MNSLFDTALTQYEIDRLVAGLFDKDLPTLWPASMPVPFFSENPPPVVTVSAFFRCSLSSILNKPVLLVNLQGLYPDHHTDVKLSRSLLARSVPTHLHKPILPLMIGLLQVLHLLAGRNENVHHSSPSANQQSLWHIR
jgi:hypothetical protein